MHAGVQREVSEALASEVVRTDPVSGGCICDAFACYLADGRKVFVKTKSGAQPGMFQAESRGLAWLAEAGALATPRVLAVSDTFLALEFIDAAAPARDFDAQFGSGLAKLHLSGANAFGADQSGFLATLFQDNRPSASWSEFYVARRLEPLIRRAVDHALVPPSWARTFEPLLEKISERMGSEERISRLHGDLWTGNVHTGEKGQPVLIDPAAYGGHREIDLAMLELFGSPSDAFYRAYQEVCPLEAEYASRTQLYQLYPLLAHVNLFGGSYIADCERIVRQYL